MHRNYCKALTFSLWERARRAKIGRSLKYEGPKINKHLKPSPGALSRADLSQRERCQNMNFSPNWICREVVAVCVITPADGLIWLPLKTT